MDEAVRWTVKVSKETDLTLRTYLGALGMKKGDLSKFIEEAVRWRIFNRTVQEIKARHVHADPGELQSIVDSTVREVRAERRRNGKKRKPYKASCCAWRVGPVAQAFLPVRAFSSFCFLAKPLRKESNILRKNEATGGEPI